MVVRRSRRSGYRVTDPRRPRTAPHRRRTMKRSGLFLVVLSGLLAACNTDDPIEAAPDGGDDPDAEAPAAPVDFTVRIENVAPWTVLKSGHATTKVVPAPGPLGPGEAYDVTFTAGKNQRLSFAAMFGESN